ncbi:MAG TPA: hypothetical protein DCE42_04395 [Myxococcales bacterium]|nr:hypothetical protein [Deltaproteobacteria bacterium]MBU48589.1 hypothetical protein [Deltaproteobacteria bacterium]HAA53967.1 hypothetical protein [Myxococcales bacterium]
MPVNTFRMIGLVACAVGSFMLFGAQSDISQTGSFVFFLIGALFFISAEQILATREQTEALKKLAQLMQENNQP